ncbi:hypothetical protein AAGG91_002884 [Salmonella enterica]|uniref:hypothetical protein n=1 Tax=Salmonella enterica TaxID=28901 RepID=UPI00138544A2|nr:hypothetical protein [Salmonella enterica subsp. enterica serovar Infantis]EHX8550367.1 hypothetical protein [Salmonella enterica]ELL7856507.1 hypothetical protein [Salmonella enterica]EME3783085.1 hypothetical protein [Salmonella enterica]MCP0435850.1 hypothetical protein [Salmonella enterica subsp. enterica serovar Mbandaka]
MARKSGGVEMSLPKKFYVARCYRSTEEVLGFMVVADAEHTKAFQKKKETADRWARGSGIDPFYVENTPQTGFQMVTNVSRYSTSNVVWRVRHPEGFEFEITSDNFMDLIETSTIIEGVIQEELFFTENRKLVSEKTKLFADMIKKEEKKEQQAQLLSDFKEGDLFQFDDDNYRNTFSDTYQYCGKYHVLVMNKNKPLCIPDKSSKKEVVLNTKTGKYYIRTKIASQAIRKVGHQAIDRESVVEALNTTLRDPFKSYKSGGWDVMDDHYKLVVAGNEKPFKLADCTVEYTDIDPKAIRTYIDQYFAYFEHNGKIMRVLGACSNYTGYYSTRNKKNLQESWSSADEMFSYNAELLENGQLHMPEVDLTTHQGFSGYRSESPFYGFSNYGTREHNLCFTRIPETIKFGTVKIGK